MILDIFLSFSSASLSISIFATFAKSQKMLRHLKLFACAFVASSLEMTSIISRLCNGECQHFLSEVGPAWKRNADAKLRNSFSVRRSKRKVLLGIKDNRQASFHIYLRFGRRAWLRRSVMLMSGYDWSREWSRHFTSIVFGIATPDPVQLSSLSKYLFT
jgi:hypothetical protein